MTLMQYQQCSPWAAMARARHEIDRAFSRQAAVGEAPPWRPAVDVYESEDAYSLQMDIPGIDPKDIDITLDKDVLTVRGERALEQADDDRGYRHVERRQGRFARRFSLPDDADGDDITAKGENGVLLVRIAKREQEQPRQIAVAA